MTLEFRPYARRARLRPGAVMKRAEVCKGDRVPGPLASDDGPVRGFDDQVQEEVGVFDPKGVAESDMWAITAYFNPAGFGRRLSNYRQFRRHLRVPLLTVELAFGEGFELGDGDADILLRRSGHDVMWQKERLLNLALAALPASCTKVAWLDCDLIFAEPDGWPERTGALLERFALVQPFSVVRMMPRDWRPGSAIADDGALGSVAYVIEGGMSVEDCLLRSFRDAQCARGIAWAARRDLLAEHGVYDLGVIGGGDGVFARSAFGYWKHAADRLRLNESGRGHLRAWAEPFHESVRGSVGYAPGEVFHLWHGSPADRRYSERHEEFASFGFDPVEDVALDDNGRWRWNSPKPEMHTFVGDYFKQRREDG